MGDARDRCLRGKEQARPAARPGRARGGDHHYAPRQGGGTARAADTGVQPRRGPCREQAHSRARREAKARSLRVEVVEILPGRRPAVSLVLDSSAALAWIYSDETTD